MLSAQKRDPDVLWKPVVTDEFQAINTEYSEGMPSLTADECEMFFHSDRPEGSAGRKDLWVATRPHPSAPWKSPRNLEEINSTAAETQPSVSADGLTLWWTNRTKGEIWQASRETRKDRFGTPRRVLFPEDSYRWEGHFEVSSTWPAPGAPAYFIRDCSKVKGTVNTDIFMVTWLPEGTAAFSSSNGANAGGQPGGN